jgi:hypothetical protein
VAFEYWVVAGFASVTWLLSTSTVEAATTSEPAAGPTFSAALRASRQAESGPYEA